MNMETLLPSFDQIHWCQTEGEKWKTWKLCPNSKVANFEYQQLSGLPSSQAIFVSVQITGGRNLEEETQIFLNWCPPSLTGAEVRPTWKVKNCEGKVLGQHPIPFSGLLHRSSQVHTSLSKESFVVAVSSRDYQAPGIFCSLTIAIPLSCLQVPHKT